MKPKKIYPINIFVKALTLFVFFFFNRFYKIRKIMPKNVKNLKPPYLLLSNHIGYWDPFVVGSLLPHYTRFVSSDAAFRNPKIRFFLKGLGTIPKKKNIRDSKVIRDIVNVIQQGDSVGIFPEAVRNWAGITQPIDRSIAKLIKMLDVPVITPVMKGMNLFNPRWSKKLRKARVDIEYSLLFKTGDTKNMSVDEVLSNLRDALQHDEIEWQRQTNVKIKSSKRAEHISHALYICPECSAIDSFNCKENNFKCIKCGYDIHIDKYGFFQRISEGKLHFENIRDWFLWEEKKMLSDVAEKFDKNYTEILFEDQKSEIWFSDSEIDLKMIGYGNIRLYIDRIEIDFLTDKKRVIMNFDDLRTINPQVNERLEIFYKSEAWRMIGSRPGVSALKWEVAVNAIWNKLGHHHKLSPYINHINLN